PGVRPRTAADVDPRPGRRQRRRGPHAAVVVSPAGRREASHRAPTLRRNPHDTAGGGRREPQTAPGGVPQRTPGVTARTHRIAIAFGGDPTPPMMLSGLQVTKNS